MSTTVTRDEQASTEEDVTFNVAQSYDYEAEARAAFAAYVQEREAQREQVLANLFDTGHRGHLTRVSTPPTRVNLPPPARHTFSQMMVEQEDRFGHVAYCGARTQYVLDESYQPHVVDGYAAARWRSMYGERLQLAMTEWGPGFNVLTAFDPYVGNFYTIVRAGDLDVDRHATVYDNAKDALQGHKEAVTTTMKLRAWHRLETQPIQDRQVMLQPV